METIKVTIFSKDANFKPTPDLLFDVMKDNEVLMDCKTVPVEADLAIRHDTDGDVHWIYTVAGKTYIVGGVTDESFTVNFPVHYGLLESKTYTEGEIFVGHFNDVETSVYGSAATINAMLSIGRYEIGLLSEHTKFNPESDVLVVEEFGGIKYQLLFRNGELKIDKTRTLIERGDIEPAMKITVNYAHSEDVALPRNIAVHY